MDYENILNWVIYENEPKTNPIKANFRKGQNERNYLLSKDYEQKTMNNEQINSNPIQTQSNPISAQKVPEQSQYKPNQIQFRGHYRREFSRIMTGLLVKDGYTDNR